MLIDFKYSYNGDSFNLTIEDDQFGALNETIPSRSVLYSLLIAAIIKIYNSKKLPIAPNIINLMFSDKIYNLYGNNPIYSIKFLLTGISFAKSFLEIDIIQLELFDQVYKQYISLLPFK